MQQNMPKQIHTVTTEQLQELDALYEQRADNGRPTGWGELVQKLRSIRRLVEADVIVQIEDGPRLQTWSSFYSWAHGRYHMLEDGFDAWIGHDAP
jgi:hypothetical protein